MMFGSRDVKNGVIALPGSKLQRGSDISLFKIGIILKNFLT